jgi:hypothetical protein
MHVDLAVDMPADSAVAVLPARAQVLAAARVISVAPADSAEQGTPTDSETDSAVADSARATLPDVVARGFLTQLRM